MGAIKQRAADLPDFFFLSRRAEKNFITKLLRVGRPVSLLSSTSARRRGLAAFHRPEFAQLEETLHKRALCIFNVNFSG